jgi:NitT/TauT family transport system permease protein
MTDQTAFKDTIALAPARSAPSSVDSEERRRWRAPSLELALPFLFAVFVLLAWEAVVWLAKLPPYILPAPSRFLSVLAARYEAIGPMAWQTLRATLIGFGCGVSIGLVLGALIGSIRLLYDMVYPSLVAFHTIPSIALIPLFVIWFGAGPHISVITAAIVCFFPVTVIVATAIAASSPELDDVMRSLGARKIDILMKVSIPRAVPQFFGSLKLAISGAFIGAIVAETIAANSGIGYVMVVATNNLDVPLAFAGLTVLSLMGVTLYVISTFVEKRLTGWAYRRP